MAIRSGLYRALRRSFDSSGLFWASCGHEDRGDGVLILAPAELIKALFVDALPSALAAALGEHNLTHPEEERIRLRMALHAGEVTYDEHGVTSASVNLTFRLVDAKPVKEALAESPGVLAVVVSEWFFDEVVRHSRETDPATFRPVRVTVKETSTVAWIGLPDHPYPPDPAHLTAPPPAAPAGPVPHQLPAAPRWFTGRIGELAALDAAAGRGGTVMITVLAGAAGVGKTWLALHYAHQHLDRFPGGQLFVDLRGFSPAGEPMAPGVALRGFLDALGVDPAQLPADLDTRAARYRDLVAGRRMLIVLDNAADTAQVTPLLPGTPTATVLITSRNHLSGLVIGHGAYHLEVGVLSVAEARQLLAKRLSDERVSAEPRAVAQLIARCGGIPLALGIVAGRAQIQFHLPLATMAAELGQASLAALDDDDQGASLPAMLSWSYRALTEEQARVFGLLGVAPGADISLPAAADLAGLPKTRTAAVLRGLHQASLLSQDIPGRYRMHDLIRSYAADHAPAVSGVAVALRRLIDFYLHTAYAGERLLDPHRQPIQLGPAGSGCHPHPLPDDTAVMAWFDAEHACLLAAQHTAATHGWHEPVWQLAWSLNTFHHRRGHRKDHLGTWRAGLAAAQALGDPSVEILAHRLLGHTLGRVGRHDEALHHLSLALTKAERNGDLPQQAHTRLALARAWTQLGDDRKALEHATHGLRVYRRIGVPAREADALNAVGWYSARLGRYDEARVHCQAALVQHRRHRNRTGEAATLDSLGYIAHLGGHHAVAVDYYRQAAAVFGELGDTYGRADTLRDLGYPLLADGHPGPARAAWREAVALYQTQQRAADADRVRRLLDALVVEDDGDDAG
ncbi:MAG TPA: tetratricopeptide repeat protein [Actinophytocola sp.]|uniref:ATP-binding protein n=1 Tax=Actinophytocola sp. TaxID=1872138 RepID=UPI002E0BFBE8|nr:tetratricopeptide repeat protein [Actinophytocola sp.]